MNLHPNIRVALCYKNFAANRHISHIGLGVTASNTAKVLRQYGVYAEVWPIVDAAGLDANLARFANQKVPITHVVISAPWIPTLQLQSLMLKYPYIEFACLSHSNVGFLQADTAGVTKIREYLDLETANANFRFGGNSRKFCAWVEQAYNDPCMWLPNLYYLDHTSAPRRPLYAGGGTLRIGAFGALRPLKNFMSAAGAALAIARSMRADLELWISAGRNEGGGNTVVDAIRAMFRGLPYAKLVENSWQTWPQFRHTVAHMHLLLAVSYTESFHVVTADGITEGVPSVCSDAIDWVPPYWSAPADDVTQIANIGIGLLQNIGATSDGLRALSAYNTLGLHQWRQYLRCSGVQADTAPTFTL